MSEPQPPFPDSTPVPLGFTPSAPAGSWLDTVAPAVLLPAFAGGLAWGIRGQYGHETGAMIAGLLVGLVLVMLRSPRLPRDQVIRAVAMGTVAVGFGGSMTYGQTIGLTQNPGMIGNFEALRWGMMGLALKGALWIGFFGTFLGMGLGGVRYRVREIILLMAGIVAASFAGIGLLNSPFDPGHRVLPALYFSADWRWEPGATLKPRPECWGGILLGLLLTLIYAGLFRKDRLALRLGFWGLLGGAVGFPAGQSLQAFHAWNLPWFREGPAAGIDPLINWWNFMETTFGAIMGGALGFGLWHSKHLLAAPPPPPPAHPPKTGIPIRSLLEWKSPSWPSMSPCSWPRNSWRSLRSIASTISGSSWAPSQ